MNDDIHSLVGAYVLDAVTADERIVFERHLRVCEACRIEVGELSALLEDLAATARAEPPTSVRRSVLDAIDGVRPLPPMTTTERADDGTTPAPIHRSTGTRNLRRFWPMVAAAVILLIGSIAAVVLSSNSGSHRSPADAVLRADDARWIEQDLDAFRASVVASRSRDAAVLVADDLPPAPPGRTYQLWSQRPGIGMQPAGFVSGSDDGSNVLLDGPLGDATAVGVTVEPAGGSSEPTSEPILVFDLS